jgi:hypothetical protein
MRKPFQFEVDERELTIRSLAPHARPGRSQPFSAQCDGAANRLKADDELANHLLQSQQIRASGE